MEFDIVSRWIDHDPILHAKRTGSYLRYIKKYWPAVFEDSPCDTDQFRLYLADKNRCRLSTHEQAYAKRCKEITYTVYAALVDRAMRATTSMDFEEVERQAEKLLQTIPPWPVLCTAPVSQALRRRVRFFRRGDTWIVAPRISPNLTGFGGKGRVIKSPEGGSPNVA